jgi:hypothetical protein
VPGLEPGAGRNPVADNLLGAGAGVVSGSVRSQVASPNCRRSPRSVQATRVDWRFLETELKSGCGTPKGVSGHSARLTIRAKQPETEHTVSIG